VAFKAIILSCSGIEGGRKKHEQCHKDDEHDIDGSRRTEFCKLDCVPPIVSRAACVFAGSVSTGGGAGSTLRPFAC
jgi:hypothetical protein